MDALTTALASHGALGLLSAALLFLVVRKDAELTNERALRVADAQNYTRMALELQARVHASIDKMQELLEQLQKGRRQ